MEDPLVLLLALFLSSLLAPEAVVRAQSSSGEGFLNVDCGKPEYDTHVENGMVYTSDYPYVDAGETHVVALEYASLGYLSSTKDLRSFPNGTRHCYTLRPVKRGVRYLVRSIFLYGNYDGKNQLPQFDIYLGVNFWDTVSFDKASDSVIREIMAVAASDSLLLCLVNTGLGTPFMSAIEVRPLPADFYPLLSPSQAFSFFSRTNFGGSSNYRYPFDNYDRYWYAFNPSQYEVIATALNINGTTLQPPSGVMSTASTAGSSSYSEFFWNSTQRRNSRSNKFLIAMHFAELQSLNKSETRIFDIYINNKIWSPNIRPVYLKTTTVYPSHIENYDKIDVSLRKTAGSTLPPIINAIEIYRIVDFSGLETDSADVAAILEMKESYNLQRNWMGDPCAPKEFIWDGLNCSYGDSSSPRIIYLNLSSSGLTGEIPAALANLSQLQRLDLSKNGLIGGIPNFLEDLPHLIFIDVTGNNITGLIPRKLQDKIAAGTLTLRIDSLQFKNGSKRRKPRTVIIAVVVSICLVISVIVVALLLRCMWKRRNSHTVQMDGNNQDQMIMEDVFLLENRKFTYDDLVKITRNFSKVIGEGGFGSVYHGVLENGVQVAVKVLSKTSSQGLKQFKNEAALLSKIHHRNLVSLFGYSSDANQLALVYEYMEKGSLNDHLSGKDHRMRPLEWKKRLEIAIGAALGLEYLHEGCKLSIIHRDVKPHNILLDRNMEAKIGDFGLSRIFHNDLHSYVTTVVMGTLGYLDPEYAGSQMLTEKSDIYSFGIVLLQLATGLPAVIKGADNTNIVDWVFEQYQKGAVKEIVDRRLDGKYDINSMWKLMEIALACASHASAERPTMSEVLAQLKACLDIQRASEGLPNSNQYNDDPNRTMQVSMASSYEEMLFHVEAK